MIYIFVSSSQQERETHNLLYSKFTSYEGVDSDTYNNSFYFV